MSTKEGNILVHSFNENFIYGLKLQDTGIDIKSEIKFTEKNRSGLLTLDDFIVQKDKAIEENNRTILTKVENIPLVKRQEAKSQIHLGNIAIDFTNPIPRGTFNTFLVENTNLIKRSNIYRNLIRMNPDCHFVFLSPVIDHTNRFAGMIKEEDANNRSSIFKLKRENKAELFLLTKILPHYLNHLRNSGKNVVLIVEDIEVLYMELYGLFRNNSSDEVYQFIREIQTLCCNTKEGSLSTICFKGAASNVDIQFQKMIDNFDTELTLLSASVIDSSDKDSKRTAKNAISGFNFRYSRTKAFSPLQSYLSLKLYDLLLKVF